MELEEFVKFYQKWLQPKLFTQLGELADPANRRTPPLALPRH
jgi:hypothetical protein